MTADSKFDLAIVGAGIIGTMVAHLARRLQPKWNLLIVDRSLAGLGATQYSVGLDLPWGRTPWHRELVRQSTPVFADLLRDIPDLPFYPIPLYGVVRRDRMSELLARFVGNSVEAMDGSGEPLWREGLRGLAVPSDCVIVRVTGAHFGAAHPSTLALLNQLRIDGCIRCLEGVAVEKLSHAKHSGFALEASDGRSFCAKRVVLATGPWIVKGLGREAAASSSIRIKKVAALHIDSPPRPEDPVLFFFDEDAFLLPVFRERRWLFSFASEDWDCDPDISQLSINSVDRDLALGILERYYPSFIPYCQGGRVFCDAYGPDRAPVVACHPDLNGCVIAGAGSGSGFRLAPGIARAALEKLSALEM